ncbi:MAG TPA: efflux RND transporter periplasmic adaptor subunit [Caldithrix abyssi]|uniref:Efflux RND transporter periplasmic adaptor subunit n=1 Tax=Caldithrix abyssi TaxID=187145 RepID=A0A7V4U1V2_CALAY|nr:efflux RND transporter periplasmic adaptor subunit [Caldithrix abyssi]
MPIKQGIFFAALMILFAGCARTEQKQSMTNTPSEKEAVIVHTAKVQKKLLNEPLRVFGQSKAFRTVDIYPKINGVVVEQKAELGDRVQKDQVLALIRQDIPGMDFSLSKLKATISGLITSESIEVGGTLNVQRPALTICQISPIMVTVPVPDIHLHSVREGQKAKVVFDALPQQTFHGAIYEIAPQLDASSHSATVRIRLENPSNRIKPGMFARIELNLSSHHGLTIPVDAVVRKGAEKYVFVIRNGMAEKRQISTGMILGNEIEVVSGLKEGDTVATLGKNYLDEGTPVRESNGK